MLLGSAEFISFFRRSDSVFPVFDETRVRSNVGVFILFVGAERNVARLVMRTSGQKFHCLTR